MRRRRIKLLRCPHIALQFLYQGMRPRRNRRRKKFLENGRTRALRLADSDTNRANRPQLIRAESPSRRSLGGSANRANRNFGRPETRQRHSDRSRHTRLAPARDARRRRRTSETEPALEQVVHGAGIGLAAG